MSTQRFSSSAGIAIGPILFVLALLGILATVMASGNGDFRVASVADRITADITTQANLIRNTINNCNLEYSLALSMGSASAIASDPPGAYPASDTSNGTAVSDLVCDPMGTTSLWGSILLPPPTKGFDAWMYMNAGASGGRCIWTQPSGGSSQGIRAGLGRAAGKFNNTTTVDASHEVIYDPNTSEKFILWITPPTDEADSHCRP